MAANGISSLPKPDRPRAKLALAQVERQTVAANGYRELNVLDTALKAPVLGRPWKRAP